ncbi:phage tail protein [Mesorhizobium sp. M1233]|uniref:phage tail protein n=1 Tax=Mesorhizobium sp. M1233 TaxID=2957072 RepID=UPI003334FD5F
MSAYPNASGDQLYALLPEVYRDRDRSPASNALRPLKAYLDAFGEVLDKIRHTLDQRYDDSFPDTTVNDRRCQEWLVPYFAELLAVRLRSPFPDGKRDEVASAVRWAQRKGTLPAAEEIVEAIAQVEGELREGFRLVATTARIGMPESPVTPDLRLASRAIQADADDPEAQWTRFGWNGRVWSADDPAAAAPESRRAPYTSWKQTNHTGAPCFPGSYEDVSRRAVDLRTPRADQGHCHPKRLTVHLPPPWGFFTPTPIAFDWSHVVAAYDPVTGGVAAPVGDYIEVFIDGAARVWRNKTGDSVEIVGAVDLAGTPPTRFEKLRFVEKIKLGAADTEFRRCAVREIAAVDTGGTLTLRDALADEVDIRQRLLVAEYTTVLGRTRVARLLASDCIFAGAVVTAVVSQGDCVRFTRVPEAWLAIQPPAVQKNRLTTLPPHLLSDVFGEPGCSVLAPDCDPAIALGAEDGGEMGCGHAWRHAANLTALTGKLSEYLPVGIEPVVTYDARLLCPPPAITKSP